MPAAPKPPIGAVIQNADGSNSIWNGSAWAPSKLGPDGKWGIDQAAMARVGLGGNARGGVMSPTELKRVDDMQQDFSNVDALNTTAQDFLTRNRKTGTGGIFAIPGVTAIAKATGLGGPDISAMDRDSNQMAVQMRAPGMRLTQMEFGKFLGSVPSVHSQGPQNINAAADITKARGLALAKSNFYSNWLNANRTLAGADQAWSDFRAQKYAPDGSPLAPPAATPTQAPAAAAKMTPAQYHAYLAQKYGQ